MFISFESGLRSACEWVNIFCGKTDPQLNARFATAPQKSSERAFASPFAVDANFASSTKRTRIPEPTLSPENAADESSEKNRILFPILRRFKKRCGWVKNKKTSGDFNACVTLHLSLRKWVNGFSFVLAWLCFIQNTSFQCQDQSRKKERKWRHLQSRSEYFLAFSLY